MRITVYKDDRTDSEKVTHAQIIGGRDVFLSRAFNGPPSGGRSYAYWACRLEDAEKVLAWVEGRTDIKRTGVYLRYPPDKRGHHVHVYVVREGHPALSKERPAKS